jgi:hypothetical protein
VLERLKERKEQVFCIAQKLTLPQRGVQDSDPIRTTHPSDKELDNE